MLDRVRIRDGEPVDADACARVLVDTWRAAYAGIVPSEVLAQLSYAEHANSYRRSGVDRTSGRFTLVAENDVGEVVGLTWAGPAWESEAVYTAEIRMLYVLPEHQHQGLGRALLRAAVQRLQEAAHAALLIWVFKDNRPARAFYEALGGEVIRKRTRELRQFPVQEVAYGWNDLRVIEARQAEPLVIPSTKPAQ